MTPRKLNVLFTTYPYAGNSTGSSMAWEITPWLLTTMNKCQQDDRIERVWLEPFCDTPITMTRNRAVQRAREMGADIIVMVDSDMTPDVHVKEVPDAEPFWDVAFNAIFEHYDRGPICIGAPYGGAPPHSNMFVFHWTESMDGGDESPFSLEQYTRQEAARMFGLQECAALPTGLIAYDVRCFDLIEPPYFYYEWKDEYEAEKASTEDVTNTRDISLAGIQRLGYNPMLCAWNSWAGHQKVWTVPKPHFVTADNISDRLKTAFGRDSMRDVDFTHGMDFEVENAGGNGRVEKSPPIHPGPDRSPPLMPLGDPAAVAVSEHPVLGEDHVTPQEHIDWICEFLKDQSKDLHRKLSIVEVGVWTGNLTKAMHDTGVVEWVQAIDNWQGCESDFTSTLASNRDIFVEFTDHVSEIPEADIGTLSMDSRLAAGRIADDAFDFVFIDADHSYESTKADIEAYWPKVRAGGYLAGHDYATHQFPGVDKAVHEWVKGLQDDGDQVHLKASPTTRGRIWYVRKPE